MRRRYLLLALVATGVSCSSRPRESLGRTQRESDSILGASKLPGAPVVKKATAVADSAAARRLLEDSITGPP